MFKLQLPSFLFHPHVTLAAPIGAVTATAGSCVAFRQAMAPLLDLPKFAPFIAKVDTTLLTLGTELGVLATVLAIVAGLGRSFAPLIDKG